jgi:competence protein ComEC
VGAVALAAGAVVGAFAPTPPGLLGGAIVMAAVVLRIAGLRWWVSAALVVGVLTSMTADAAWRATEDPPQGPIEGVVRLVGDPTPMDGGGWRVEVRHEGRRLDAEFGGAHLEVGDLLAGTTIQVTAGSVRPARRWQRFRHVAGTIEVDHLGATGPAGRIYRAANGLRRLLWKGSAPLGEREASLLAGLVLGDDRAQSASTADDFRAAGLGHLLAVSGQNVAFVLAAAAPGLGRLRYRWRLPLTLLLLGFFAIVTRFEPSVLRATVMAGGSALAAARGRQAGGARLLAATVAGLVVLDPFLVHRAAFRLSVAASAGILLAARPLADSLPGPRIFRETAGVTLAAQAAVTPLLLAGFGPVPVAALPANLLAAPVAGPLMVWGITGGLVAGILGSPVDALVHAPPGVGLRWIAAVGAWSASHPTGYMGTVLGSSVAGSVAMAAWLSHRGRVGQGRGVLLGVGIVLLAVAGSTLTGSADTGADAGIRVLGQGEVVVVDRLSSTRRLLADLRRRSVDQPTLLVFREPVPAGVGDALDLRFGTHQRWGPPASVGAVVPASGTRFRVDGTTWVVHLERGLLLVRRAPA